jgi:protein-tyrosine phosphatase
MAVFRIVTVCTGNICRSPLAAVLLNHWAARAGLGNSVHATSGGTRPAIGAPMHQRAVAIARSHGAPAPVHAAHPLSAPQLAEADLILAADRENRADAVRTLPRIASRAYTIREFAALASSANSQVGAGEALPGEVNHDPLRGAAIAMEQVARRRGLGPPRAPADADIADPMARRPRDAFQRLEAELVPALSAVFVALFGPMTGAGVVGPVEGIAAMRSETVE